MVTRKLKVQEKHSLREGMWMVFNIPGMASEYPIPVIACHQPAIAARRKRCCSFLIPESWKESSKITTSNQFDYAEWNSRQPSLDIRVKTNSQVQCAMRELHAEAGFGSEEIQRKRAFAPMAGTKRTDTITQIEAVGQLGGDSKDLVNELAGRNLVHQEC
jgi:hypothetical protein